MTGCEETDSADVFAGVKASFSWFFTKLTPAFFQSFLEVWDILEIVDSCWEIPTLIGGVLGVLMFIFLLIIAIILSAAYIVAYVVLLGLFIAVFVLLIILALLLLVLLLIFGFLFMPF